MKGIFLLGCPLGFWGTNGPFLPLNDKNFLLDFLFCLRLEGGASRDSTQQITALFGASRPFPPCFAS